MTIAMQMNFSRKYEYCCTTIVVKILLYKESV